MEGGEEIGGETFILNNSLIPEWLPFSVGDG